MPSIKFPLANEFEKYGAVKLFRQLIAMNDDEQLVIRASLSGNTFTETASASDFFEANADSGGPYSHTFADFATAESFTVYQIIVCNDSTSDPLYVNFNDDASLSTYKIVAGEAINFTMSHAGGEPITSISYYADVGVPPVVMRVFAFGSF